MATEIISLEKLLAEGDKAPNNEWGLKAVQSDQCISYAVWNSATKEALLVDPKDEDLQAYRMIAKELNSYRWIAVIDTHTHADHVSVAAQVAEELGVPLVMHENAPSKRVHIRISKDTAIPTQAGPLQFLITPGHTQDSVTAIWGPFIFGGDTILFGDVGRDDLPGGSAEDHYDSIQKVKACAQSEMILLPGHAYKGGQASTWGTQLRINSSLTQPRDEFIKEAGEYDAPAPALLKKSLKENFK